MLGVKREDRLWMWLCAASFCAYLALSESVRAFGAEITRLAAKFLG